MLSLGAALSSLPWEKRKGAPHVYNHSNEETQHAGGAVTRPIGRIA